MLPIRKETPKKLQLLKQSWTFNGATTQLKAEIDASQGKKACSNYIERCRNLATKRYYPSATSFSIKVPLLLVLKIKQFCKPNIELSNLKIQKLMKAMKCSRVWKLKKCSFQKVIFHQNYFFFLRKCKKTQDTTPVACLKSYQCEHFFLKCSVTDIASVGLGKRFGNEIMCYL